MSWSFVKLNFQLTLRNGYVIQDYSFTLLVSIIRVNKGQSSCILFRFVMKLDMRCCSLSGEITEYVLRIFSKQIHIL